MRECVLNTLDSWIAVVHLDQMVTYVAIGLVDFELGAEEHKSFGVRKATETCITGILRVSGHEMIEKVVKDIHGPALALVLEKLKPYGAFQESFELARLTSIGITSKGITKGWEINSEWCFKT
ncbi:hypothetical protein KIW84_032404 [Lathyrus oleraceus]|uniref:Uncharacterized protein n=1 Tax=Pisum sativum TaxID=3888 RepID=A0A9D4XT13_PEA|nr:hypothetical protein KIW84_032404 [Pisum sativum]